MRRNGKMDSWRHCITSMTAKIEDVTGLSETIAESPVIHIEDGTVWLDEASYITVYKDNGTKVYSGKDQPHREPVQRVVYYQDRQSKQEKS